MVFVHISKLTTHKLQSCLISKISLVRSLSNMPFSLDVLQPISQERLEIMEAICKEKLPLTLRAHHYIFNFNRWRREYSEEYLNNTISCDLCRVVFYGHRDGDVNNCTFVAISGEKNYHVAPFTLQESCEELQECIEKTKRIKWEQGPYISHIEDTHAKALKNVLASRKVYSEEPNYIMYIPREDILKYSIKIPVGTHLGPLKATDAELVDNVWQFQNHGSLEYIRTLITLNGGVGLYSNENEQLLSWILTSDNFCPGFAQTIPSARRKGYAEVCMQFLLKTMAKNYNTDGLAFVLKSNVPSRKLLEKVGYRIISTCNWYLMEKESYDNS